MGNKDSGYKVDSAIDLLREQQGNSKEEPF